MALIRRALSRFITAFRTSRAERELAREMDAHLRLLEDDFVARGLTRTEARYAARRAFGGVEQAKEHHRDARSFRVLGSSWLDVKLGARMLVKYPGLSLVGGLGMAVAIAIATAGFSIVTTLLDPVVPLPGGGRLVALQTWDTAAKNPDSHILHDVVTWREELTTVEDVGAYRTLSRNLIAAGAPPEVVPVAEITASAFRLVRVPPMLGRPLLESDERPEAPPVVVIAHDVWRARFFSDPSLVGRTIQLGSAPHTIVGVMPDGFAFPVNHSFWVPLRLDPSHYPRREGPALTAFGRLAPGVTLAQARAEMGALGKRTSTAYPEVYAHLRPDVVPYTYPFTDMDDPNNAAALGLIQFLLTLLLILVAVNVAILVYARTASRQAELAVRTALGASRCRIVGQLFVEALVLSLVSALAGLVIAGVGLARLNEALMQITAGLPFWMDFRLSSAAVVYVLGLSVLAAAVVGAIPALKATGRLVQNGLRDLGAGGSGLRLGRTWTYLLVAQVAFTVALLPPVVYNAWQLARQGTADFGFATDEFLTAQLTMDRTRVAPAGGDAAEREFARRYADRTDELLRRLQAEPAVRSVSFALGLPGEEATVWTEIEGVRTPTADEAAYASGFGVRDGTGAGHEVRFGRVALDYFAVFAVPVLAGRGFTPGDIDPASPAVIVNRTFSEQIMKGASPIGRRIRYVGRSGDAQPEHVDMARWYEIVGVVEDFPRSVQVGTSPAKLYHAASPADLYPLLLSVGVREGHPAAFAARLREVAAAADPDMQLRNVAVMDEALRREHGIMRLLAGALAGLTLSVVLLSGAGIYSLMSFTVVQRRKEIGIRAALGADARRILAGVFWRATRQPATGALIGGMVAVLLDRVSDGDLMQGQALVMMPLVAVFMMLVGLLAALGPARRGLRIQPTDALREQ